MHVNGATKPVRLMNGYRYDFEKPLAELEQRLEAARKAAGHEHEPPATVKTLEAQLDQLKRHIYGHLTP